VSSSAEGIEVRSRPARWPWAVLAIFLLIAFAGTALVVPNGESVVQQVPFIIAFSMFGVVGALILSRDRGNVIGALLMVGAIMTASSFLSGELMTWLIERGHNGPVVVFLGFMNNFGWSVGILTVVLLLPLLFPDGHLPSKRWRPFLWVVVTFLVLLNLSFIIGQKTLTGSTTSAEVANPFYVRATAHLPNMDIFVGILTPLFFGVSVASVFVRYRQVAGLERQQIRWVAFGLSAAFVSIIVSNFVPQDTALSAIIAGAGFLAFPLSIGVAVLRFHLYDLDVVVRKTVVYAALALFATAVYLALVVGLGAWLGQGSSFLTMVAAVIVAVTFEPIRKRLTRLANRLVYGERATPYEVLSEFSERVGDAYSEADVLPRMVRILGEGVGAARADVWLAVDREMRDVASWPSDARSLEPLAIADGEVPTIAGADRVYAVRQSGELLGALAVRKPPSDPMSPGDERLIADLAG